MNVIAAILLFVFVSSPLIGGVGGLSQVESITKRDDGRFDVACSYGEAEANISLDELLAGQVCLRYGKFSSVGYYGFSTAGYCNIFSYTHSQRLAGSVSVLGRFILRPSDGIVSCYPTFHYKVPKNHRIGVKEVSIQATVSKDFSQDLRLLVTGKSGSGQQHQEFRIENRGSFEQTLVFGTPIYSSCSGDRQMIATLAWGLFFMSNGSDESNGHAELDAFKFKNVFIEKCP